MTSRTLHTFAHDLRRCLRTALTRTQLVRRSASQSLADQDRRFLEDSEVALIEMDRLLDSFVAYADATNWRYDSSMRFDLIVRGVVLEARKDFDRVEGRIVVSGEIPSVPVSTTLRVVLRELLENAVKFRRREVPLEAALAFREQNGWLEMDVSDNGIGVDARYAEQIFFPFQRLHSNREYAGFGLGLATARALIAGLDGELSLLPKPTPGSLFRCRIPLLAAPGPSGITEDAHQATL